MVCRICSAADTQGMNRCCWNSSSCGRCRSGTSIEEETTSVPCDYEGATPGEGIGSDFGHGLLPPLQRTHNPPDHWFNSSINTNRLRSYRHLLVTPFYFLIKAWARSNEAGVSKTIKGATSSPDAGQVERIRTGEIYMCIMSVLMVPGIRNLGTSKEVDGSASGLVSCVRGIPPRLRHRTPVPLRSLIPATQERHTGGRVPLVGRDAQAESPCQTC